MKQNKDWYKTFFKTFGTLQSNIYTPEQTKKQANFIFEILNLKRCSRILDVPCGNGRIGFELAKKGCSVTGIDFNENIIEKAKHALKKRKLKVDFHIADMRKIEWKNKFDAVICWWGSFGYFDEKGNRDFVKAVSTSLKKRGRFIIDTHIIETLLPKYQPRSWEKFGDYKVLEERKFDFVKSRIDVDWTFIKGGK
jgi:cyclopropane fatty-acyl-phospholipid synthase-like methyltransferase